MEFKHIKNIAPDTAEIRLMDDIGRDSESGKGIFGADVAYEIAAIERWHPEIKNIVMVINSPGGSVLDGYSIMGAMLASKLHIITHNVGLAASIAGVIYQCGDERKMNDYALFMLHNTSTDGDEKVDNVLKMMNQSLATIFNNRTSIKPEDIVTMMETETWMDASECISKGFCDEVVGTEIKDRYSVKATNKKDLVKIFNKINLPEIMKKDELCKVLNLDVNTADDVVINTAIAKIKNNADEDSDEVKTLKEELEALKAENAELKTKSETDTETTAEAVVNAAVLAGKIKAEFKTQWIANAKKDLSGTQALLATMATVKEAQKISNVIKDSAGAETEMSFSEMSKKNPAGLEKIRNESPDLFRSMYIKEYKKDPITGQPATV